VAGYSGTPLPKKLGLKPGIKVYFYDLPDSIRQELLSATAGASVLSRLAKETDFMHVFFAKKSDLAKVLPKLKTNLAKDGCIWISWPKKTSKIASDLTGDIVRQMGLDIGLVDIKVCAVDIQWSGLKFVFRKKDR
jgi:hypothetical protein